MTARPLAFLVPVLLASAAWPQHGSTVDSRPLTVTPEQSAAVATNDGTTFFSFVFTIRPVIIRAG